MKNKKNIIIIICIILVIVTTYYLRGLSTKKEEAKIKEMGRQEQILEKKNKEMINNLIAKYNAIEYKDDLENPTTLSLQNTLINEKPVAFTDANINDISVRNSRYYITATLNFITLFWTNNFVVELECPKEISENINNIISSISANPYDDTNTQNRFAVVATINDIYKPQFKATSYNDDEYNTGIEIDSDSDIFLLKGKCVDIVNY